jgi:hypothetical protein
MQAKGRASKMRDEYTKDHVTVDELKASFKSWPDWICIHIYRKAVHLQFINQQDQLKIGIFPTEKMLSSAEAVELVKSFGFEPPEIKRRAPTPPMIR